MKSQRVRLPNGMEVYSNRGEEALLMYGDVGNYVKNGMTLKANDVIFDVGANIGIFSLWAYHQCKRQITVYAFEPIPKIFEILEANFKHIDNKQLKAFNIGLSNQSGQVSFAYYPNATFASTAYPDSAQEELKLTETLLGRSLNQLPAPLSLIRYMPLIIRKPFVQLLSRYINQRQYVTCKLQTISEVIDLYHVKKIDFLKIDAEKSELDILNGIEDKDWDKVQQVFAEVHNREGRVEIICDLLHKQHFSTVIHEQDPFFADTDICTVYATR